MASFKNELRAAEFSIKHARELHLMTMSQGVQGEYLDFLDPERERERELEEDLDLELEPE